MTFVVHFGAGSGSVLQASNRNDAVNRNINTLIEKLLSVVGQRMSVKFRIFYSFYIKMIEYLSKRILNAIK